MIKRIPALGGISIAIALGVCSAPQTAVAQQSTGSKAGWTHPMTPWGEPDLQGMWPLNHLISTPFQRPERFGERRFLTDEEFAAAQKSAEARNTRFESGAIPQADSGQATRLTSLMSDPPNGRFPALTAKGKELYDKMLAAKPTRGLRHGIIHDNTPTDHAIDVMARLQKEFDAGYPESQAPFAWWLGDNYAGNLGPDRAPRLNPFHTYVTKGIRWAGGSDYSVTPFPARYGLWASVARQTLNGTYGATPFGTNESVDIKTALRSYTTWAAHQIFLDDRVGSIEAGKDADIAVWDRNMYNIPTAELKDLRCEMTLVRGKVVFVGRPF